MSSCSAASRREAPPSTRAITRTRIPQNMSSAWFGPQTNQCRQTRPFTGPWESRDSIRQEHALGSRGVVGRDVHGGSDALIGSASTDVGHGLIDVLVGWLRRSFEQRRGGHDLSRLAIAALGHVDRRPGLLHGMRAGGRESLDGHDPVARLHVSDANGAGALHLVIDVHGAGATLRDPAAVFRAGEADLLADDP